MICKNKIKKKSMVNMENIDDIIWRQQKRYAQGEKGQPKEKQ